MIQHLQGIVDLLFKRLLVRVVQRIIITIVFQKLTEVAVIVVSDRLIE